MQAVRVSHGHSRSLAVIAKALKDDPHGGAMLAELTIYEAMCDLVDIYGPALRVDVAKAARDARSSLVRDYVAKRLAGDDVTDLLEAAGVISGLSKADSDDHNPDHRATPEKRDKFGRWTKANLDLMAAFTSAGSKAGLKTDDVPNRQGYKNLKATGQALSAFGAASGVAGNPGAAHLVAAGATAQLAGELGPQAEKILGNPLRRTAYRYRGTEKTPDKKLQNQVHDLSQRAQTLGDAFYSGDPTKRAQVEAVFNGLPDDPTKAALNAALRSNKNGDQARLAASQDFIAAQMIHDDRIPDLKAAKLSHNAGQMPPSVGYIVDSDGDVVSEAQGVNGDHYLPFDLKNLHAMHGGGYVRTRTVGGPTDEDLYTALATGARRLTVVSHSGVFTMQFAPDVRGSRRNSDKSRAMVKRYSQLLAQIDSGKEMETAFSPETIAAIKAKARGSAPGNAKAQHEKFNELLDERKQELLYGSDEDLDTMAEDQVASLHAPQTGYRATNGPAHAQQLREAKAQIRAEQERVYRLDGHGYSAAMSALQQEFPFYLEKPTFEPTNKFLEARGQATVDPKQGANDRTKDLGYTKRKALTAASIKRPAAAAAEKEPDAAAKPEGGSDAGAAGAGATAALGTKTPSAGLNASQIGESAIGRKARAAMQDELYDIVKLKPPTGADEDEVASFQKFAPISGANDEEAEEQNTNLGYVAHVARKYPADTIVGWLTGTATRTQLDKLQAGLEELAQETDLHTDKAVAAIDSIKRARWTYDSKAADPALATGDNPQRIDGVPTGTDMQTYIDYLQANPDVLTKAQEMAKDTDPEIAEQVRKEVASYEEVRAWGDKVAQGNVNDIERPSSLRSEDEEFQEENDVQARDLAVGGRNHARYTDMLDMQKAWSALRGLQVASDYQGAPMPDLKAGGAGPKVGFQPEGVGKRVQVHRLGSPASVSLSKKLSPPAGSHAPRHRLRHVRVFTPSR